MGKEWFGGGGGNNRSAAKREMKESSASGGCMSAVFDLVFHFQFPSTHRNDYNTPPNNYPIPFLQEKATTTTATGVEAPRNSLELETAAIDEASVPQAMKQEQNLNFPVGIKIKTGHGRILSPRISTSNPRFDESISSKCTSPKTPSVVARLMGLDLLPDSTSPSIKSRNHSNLLQITFFDDQLSARSLPETPRTSSSSRKSDVERHRLSLQISKENLFGDKFSLSDDILACRRGKSDRKRSVVRQDITNIINNNGQSTKDQNLSLLKNKRNNSKILSKYGDENTRQSKIEPTTTTKSPRISPSYGISHREQKHKDSKKVGKKLMSRREDGFVRSTSTSTSTSSSRERNKEENKSKRRPLSCPTQLLKNGPSPTTHAKLPQKKSQVSDSLSPKSNPLLSAKPTVSPCSTTGGAAALHGGCSPEQRNYIQIILKHINITKDLAKWHTPSQPIDPKLFHHLEFLFKAAAADGCKTILRRRCERKLIFQLVDELLAEILTRSFQSKRRDFSVDEGGCSPAVVEALCKKIESFPAAKCVVLEDIDSLIDRDLMSKSEFSGFWGEDEGMVSEIEGDIMEWLVREAVAVMGGDAAEEQTGICHVGLCRGETIL